MWGSELEELELMTSTSSQHSEVQEPVASTSTSGLAPGPKSFCASAAATAPIKLFYKMGAVVSTMSEAWNDLCGGRRWSVLEERVSDLEASQRYSQSLGLSVCCASDKRSKGAR